MSPSIVLSVKTDGSQNHSHCWKGVKYADAGKECAGPGGFFWTTAGSWTAQDKKGTHRQLSQNIKTVVDHPDNDSQDYVHFWFGLCFLQRIRVGESPVAYINCRYV